MVHLDDWKAQYGYVFLGRDNQDVAIDGMNEAGLSVEALYLPNYAKYELLPAGKNNQALPYIHFGDWVLSNFKSVDEVQKALPSVFVVAEKIPGLGDMIFVPIHFAIYDATGKGIVVEYIDGKRMVYENKIGIMTNSPGYNWHLTNMNNYVHLTPTNPNPVLDNGLQFVATGQGYGMIGTPGDISPPSRFIKTAVLTRVVIPADNALGTLNLAEHIINNVDIPRGLARRWMKTNIAMI